MQSSILDIDDAFQDLMMVFWKAGVDDHVEVVDLKLKHMRDVLVNSTTRVSDYLSLINNHTHERVVDFAAIATATAATYGGDGGDSDNGDGYTSITNDVLSFPIDDLYDLLTSTLRSPFCRASYVPVELPRKNFNFDHIIMTFTFQPSSNIHWCSYTIKFLVTMNDLLDETYLHDSVSEVRWYYHLTEKEVVQMYAAVANVNETYYNSFMENLLVAV